MLRQFQVYSKVVQLHMYSFSFRSFSRIGCCRILSRVSVLYSRLLLVIYFVYSGVCMPLPILYRWCIQSENLRCLGSVGISDPSMPRLSHWASREVRRVDVWKLCTDGLDGFCSLIHSDLSVSVPFQLFTVNINPAYRSVPRTRLSARQCLHHCHHYLSVLSRTDFLIIQVSFK